LILGERWQQEDGENIRKIVLAGDKLKGNEKDRACNVFRDDENLLQNFSKKTWKKKLLRKSGNNFCGLFSVTTCISYFGL
jgi:hypothetical protein